MATSLTQPFQARPFDLGDVQLLPGPFRSSMVANATYLLQLEPNRLLAGFYKSAGLPAKGEAYGGWESMGVAGHTLGHYLTACSLQYASTKDERFLFRVRDIVKELDACQQARKDGYIGAIPDADRVWAELRKGEISSKGFDLNGVWVPWYTLHKQYAGLIDAHRLTGDPLALKVATRLADWAIDLTKDLSPAQWQTMLACEHGGMNESLAELFALTGEKKYLELARKFHHDAVLNPLAKKEDRLAGLHSNTQIPKVIGLARLFELEGKAEDRTASEFFWSRLAEHRSYVIGGNSNQEHLAEADKLNEHLSNNTAETCNTYNLLKLTRHLFSWAPNAKYFDFYERALFNHIQASQNPEDGMLMYFLPLQTGAVRNYSTPFDSFWCCVGTGIENHTKYNESIYFHRDRQLYVNLFIPSRLDWKELGVKLRQETSFPASPKTDFVVDQTPAERWAVAIRVPAWISGKPSIRLNGRTVKASESAEGYLVVDRVWMVGDKLSVSLPYGIRTEAMPDNPRRLALLAGPVVLAAELPETGEAPYLIEPSKPVGEWLKPVRGKPLHFKSQGLFQPKDLTFLPYSEVRKQTHATYFDVYTPAEWKAEEARVKAEAARIRELEKRTVDSIRVGEMQPERDHDFQGEKLGVGEHSGRKWRHAVDGGWMSFKLKAVSGQDLDLICTYWGSDTGRTFDILADGVRLATEKLVGAKPGQFMEVSYTVPKSLLEGKTEITIRFQAHPNNFAGGLYGCRLVRRA